MHINTSGVAACLGALALVLFSGTSGAAAPADLVQVPSSIETAPVPQSGDAADDPAIWVNVADPARSLVIGNDKNGALDVYNLDGTRRQRITTPSGFWGNVDVRGNIVAASKSGIRVFRVNPAAAKPLVAARESAGNAASPGEGLCMYDPGAPGLGGGLYVIHIERPTFRVRVHPLTDGDADGLLTVGATVREFRLGSEGEGCVADDVTGRLYISEEDVAIWRYDLTAAGTGEPPRVRVAHVGPDLAADSEGLALVNKYLIASAQNVANPQSSWFNVYDTATLQRVRSFRVVAGTVSDDCDQTDGIAASAVPLGARFAHGLFVCQDGRNEKPRSGNQNFKFVPLDKVLPPVAAPG